MAKIREEQAKTGADKTLPPTTPAVKRINENGEEEVILSKRKQKKMERNPHKAFSKVGSLKRLGIHSTYTDTI